MTRKQDRFAVVVDCTQWSWRVVHLVQHTEDKPVDGLLPAGSLQILPGSGQVRAGDDGRGTAHTRAGDYNHSLCSEQSVT